MFLRLYSLVILALDLVTVLFGVWFAILVALYQTFRPPALKNLSGELAMVVGAGRGVGREIAIQLSQLGVSVACIDINANNCCSTVRRSHVGMAKAFICDVTDQVQVRRTVESIRLEMGGDVTMVLHCCGVPSPRALIQEAPEVKRTLEVSVLSHFWLLDSVLPGMQRAGRGHIVALSSVAGLSGGTNIGGRVPISTAQFAVQGFAESLHTEFRQSNSNIIMTLVHVYPFIVGAEAAKDIRLRIPSYFGTMPATDAARMILNGVRRNYAEFSVPGYLLYLGHILRILPKKASFMLRDLLDTGVDFG
ncbi:17-beta-hydroxysteroid dehydrogenase 13-like isoform X2 [Venturia canescens]|nr:17-beta-hydroxysteroid dehydrogenase 13-like isoform X2 [Venturia canescens]